MGHDLVPRDRAQHRDLAARPFSTVRCGVVGCGLPCQAARLG